MSYVAARVGVVVLLCLPALAAAGGDAPDLTRLTARELQARLHTGEITSRAVTQAFLARIRTIDDAGPTLNAVVQINPDAEAIATELDQRRGRDGPVGPLHGLPVILKASIDTGDRMVTHAGSLALADHRAPADAHLVKRLREAGAVILGKANMSEWANFRSTRSSSGWSSVGGQTRNPHVLDRNPCGSSSGSAVAVAARLVPLAVGTETDGSIVCPSGVNGIVGIKPTVGTVSRQGIVPISHTQDTAGPMARTVADAALLLQVMVGYDADDPAPRAFPEGPPELPEASATARLDGLRIGVYRSYYGAGNYPEVDAVYEQAVDTLRTLGATLVDPFDFQVPEGASDAEYTVMLHEFKAGLNDYLASHPLPDDRDTLAELIVWNDAHAEQVMPLFGQEIFLAAEAVGGLEAEAYHTALTTGPGRMREALEARLVHHDLDAFVTAANSFAWKTDWVAGDRFMVGSSSLAAMSGFPSVAVPAGQVSGLPVGVAFVSGPFGESVLIRIAYAFELATGALQEPRFVPTLEVANDR